MTVVHSAPALHTTHRSTQECLETYARTEENPVLLGQALDEYTNIYLQQLEPHLAQQLAQALRRTPCPERARGTLRGNSHG